SDYHEDEAYARPKVASIEDKELFTDYMEEWSTWEHAQSEVGAGSKKDAKAAREQDVLAFAQANAPVEEGKSLFSRPVSVLAIDDNNMNLFLISNRLRRFGAQADIANSAESALSMASEKSYDLILMDRYLPSMNGPELVRAMREQKLCEGTPIVLMSAGSEDTKEELRREGFAGSLPKPFTLHQLRDLLIQVLPESVDKTLPEVQEVLSGKEDAPVEEDTKEEAPEEEDAPEEKETTIPVSLRPAFYLFGLVLVLVYILMVLLLAKGSVRVVLMTVGCAVYLLLDLFYCRLTGSSAKTIRILPLPLILLCILAGTLGASESEAFLFFPVLLITPLLLQRASPAWNRLVLVLSSALFLLLDFSEKTRDIFQKDLIHTVSALILAVVFSLVLQRQRAQEEDLLSRYRELSEYDQMTHTKNYDRMREDIKPLFGQKVTFLYTSIDRFRLICDTCGTQEANDLLSFFAATLQKIFGEEHCYRYYGAVFLVISTDLSLEELRKKCSEFGRAVSRYEIAHRRLHPTCSGSYDRILLTGEEDLQSLNHRLGMKLYEIQTLG
ncbi:MAG: response regulator, partial [Lachnospiraceae bacterium]